MFTDKMQLVTHLRAKSYLAQDDMKKQNIVCYTRFRGRDENDEVGRLNIYFKSATCI